MDDQKEIWPTKMKMQKNKIILEVKLEVTIRSEMAIAKKGRMRPKLVRRWCGPYSESPVSMKKMAKSLRVTA